MSVRVLIVDSDKYLLAAYKEQLASEGFDVVTAQDGLECLQRVRHFRPDVVVLDPAIPWGGGDGVVTLMHEDPDVPEVPLVLILTSGCSALVLYNVARFPISDYLGKPITARFLAQRIRAALARREEREAVALDGKTS